MLNYSYSLCSKLICSLFFVGLLFSCSDSKEEDPKPEIPNVEEGLPDIFRIGNKIDKVTDHQEGIVLAGGGTDNDQAMQWMLKQADGGDVVILRASGGDGYNSYFFSKLGVMLNSVTTIILDSRDKAQKDSVSKLIRQAEVLFIAGGDQLNYIDHWKETKTAEAINYLIKEKKAVIGGTSAGMAILGEIVYSAEGVYVDEEKTKEILQNPYDPAVTLQESMLDIALLKGVITDTHFSERDRMGRLITFMARIHMDWALSPKSIACDEYTAVCINKEGLATVFGGNAFFLSSAGVPESCEKDKPLNWLLDGKAIRYEKIRGKSTGEPRFDIKTWAATEETHGYITVEKGILNY